MVELYSIKLADIINKEEFLTQSVDSSRRKKALKYFRLEDRLRCLAAGYLMKYFLPDYSEDSLVIAAEGKPHLKDGVSFSLSHGGDYIVLAWSKDVDSIGIDVEEIVDINYYKKIIPMYCTKAECQYILADAAKAVQIWTRKEALYKCIGQGISDFRELPEVIEDKVSFLDKEYYFKSWTSENHSFSLALSEMDELRFNKIIGGNKKICVE